MVLVAENGFVKPSNAHASVQFTSEVPFVSAVWELR